MTQPISAGEVRPAAATHTPPTWHPTRARRDDVPPSSNAVEETVM